MSFVAVVDSDKHKLIWSKAIISLAAISDSIRFCVQQDSLTLLAVNSARITHGQTTFKNSFFYEYTTNFDDVMEEGYDEDAHSYSFLVNSRHLAVLFKNLDVSDLNYVCFKINWEKKCPTPLKYKLLIEIRTKKQIIKKYQTSYQPIVMSDTNVILRYKAELVQQQEQSSEVLLETMDDKIKYLMMSQIIPKQFLDMIPATTEDFKIEIKNGKISFSGYTRQVMKDREYLKQPMAVTITLRLDELINSNVNCTDPNDYITTSINFRLKDFKNFIAFISSFNYNYPKNAVELEDYIELNSPAEEAYFEIFFKGKGDPVLFELLNYPHVLVQYIQITGDDTLDHNNNEVNEDVLKRPRFLLPVHSIQKTPAESLTQQETPPSPATTKPRPRYQHTGKYIPSKSRSSIIDNLNRNQEEAFQFTPSNNSQLNDSQLTHSPDTNDREVIGYSERRSSVEPSAKRHKPEQYDHDTDYLEDEEEEEKDDEDNLGPTQADGLKSIFNWNDTS